MMTIDMPKEFIANTKEGRGRCFGNEEFLRARTEMDYSELLKRITEQKEKLTGLCSE